MGIALLSGNYVSVNSELIGEDEDFILFIKLMIMWLNSPLLSIVVLWYSKNILQIFYKKVIMAKMSHMVSCGSDNEVKPEMDQRYKPALWVNKLLATVGRCLCSYTGMQLPKDLNITIQYCVVNINITVFISSSTTLELPPHRLWPVEPSDKTHLYEPAVKATVTEMCVCMCVYVCECERGNKELQK